MKLSDFGRVGLAGAVTCLPCVAVVLFGIGLGGVFASVLAVIGDAPLLAALVGATAVIAAAGGLVWAVRRRSCEVPVVPESTGEPTPTGARSQPGRVSRSPEGDV